LKHLFEELLHKDCSATALVQLSLLVIYRYKKILSFFSQAEQFWGSHPVVKLL